VEVPWALLGMQTGAATVKNSIEVPQKIKNRITMWSSCSTVGYLSEKQNHYLEKIPLCSFWHYLQ